jgi:hypothetical protein
LQAGLSKKLWILLLKTRIVELKLNYDLQHGGNVNNYIKHAYTEFKAAGWLDENELFTDDMQQAICEHVCKLLQVFGEEGHSGSSAPYAIDLFAKLAKFEPIAPLTGEDWEWTDTGHNYQNKRCSHVFKDADGSVYDINGKVFWEWCKPYDGREPFEPYKSYYTCRESRTPVTFPYTPKTEYVYRHSDAEPQQPPQNEEGFL